MTRRNGGVVETCQHMEYVEMIIRRIAIEGDWFTIQFFQESDGSVRVEMVHDVRGKYYKMYPNNKIMLDTKESID